MQHQEQERDCGARGGEVSASSVALQRRNVLDDETVLVLCEEVTFDGVQLHCCRLSRGEVEHCRGVAEADGGPRSAFDSRAGRSRAGTGVASEGS